MHGKGDEKFNPLPQECRTSVFPEPSSDSLPGCSFFDVQYNEILFAEGSSQPYSGGSPLIFDTTGYNSESFLGYLTFICKYCDKGDTVTVTLGFANNTKECVIDKTDRKPEILKNRVTGEETEYTRLSCRVPPYEGKHVPVVVSRGLSKTLPFYVSYRPPAIINLASSTTSANCYSVLYQSNEKTCESATGCVWDSRTFMCVLSVETAGSLIDIIGKNFGTKNALAYFGMDVGDTTHAQNIEIVFHSQNLIRSKIPPLENATYGIIWCRSSYISRLIII